jgi:hypothetical protein
MLKSKSDPPRIVNILLGRSLSILGAIFIKKEKKKKEFHLFDLSQHQPQH